MDSKFVHRLVRKIFRVGKILGQNFIFGLKKNRLGWKGVPGKQYSKNPAPVVSM
jgi:hypothetical protein